jgi:hypothetical protein
VSREVRHVPEWWVHPKDKAGEYIPMWDESYLVVAREYAKERAEWERGEFPSYADEEDHVLTFEQWSGPFPNPCRYMPDFLPEERTHLMMYESTSEGTPISPAFKTPEELAQWLVDNNASAFGSTPASYKGWLAVAKGAYAPTMVMRSGSPPQSGVDYVGERYG